MRGLQAFSARDYWGCGCTFLGLHPIMRFGVGRKISRMRYAEFSHKKTQGERRRRSALLFPGLLNCVERDLLLFRRSCGLRCCSLFLLTGSACLLLFLSFLFVDGFRGFVAHNLSWYWRLTDVLLGGRLSLSRLLRYHTEAYFVTLRRSEFLRASGAGLFFHV